MADGDLATLAEVKTAIGIPSANTQKDDQINQAITWASALIRKVTDRDFGTATVTEEREYLYDGSGFLEVDDLSDLTEVAINGGVIDLTLVALGPDRAPDGVYYWIEGLPTSRPYGSPEMGFTRNEDTLPSRILQAPARAQVSATFGWPTVPTAVKQAVIWTVANFIANPSPFISESIEGYSRTRALPAGADTALPARAVDVLGLYVRGVM